MVLKNLRTKPIESSLNDLSDSCLTLQAAIVAVHSNAADLRSTDWNQIIALYDVHLKVLPSPVVELNRALAVAQRDGPAAALVLVERMGQTGELAEYYLFHAARADLCRQLGRTEEARLAYQQAIALTQQTAERRFLEGQLATLSNFR